MMKTLANFRAVLLAAILTTFGVGLTSAVHADIETVTVLATQASLVELEIEKNGLNEDLAENFSDEILIDLDKRLPQELDLLIALAD